MGKHKKGTCMADGGITQETPEQLMARIQAKYNVSGNLPPAPVPQPMAQPALQPAPQTQASGQGILSLLKNRGAQIDKAANYANGGIVKGKGTPTSDDVPVKIKGKDFNLSDTEAVLPSKTRQALGELLGADPGDVGQANALVEKFIAQTNGKPPVDVEEGTSLADGGLLDDESRKMSYQGVTGIQAPSPTPVPAAQTGGDAWSLGKSGPGATLQVTTGDAARLPAPVVQQGVDTMRSQLAKPASLSPVSSGVSAVQAATPMSKPIDTSYGPTVSDGAGGVYTPERGSGPGILAGISNFFADSAKAARGDKSYEQIRAERAAGESATQPAQAPGQTGQTAFKVYPFAAPEDKFALPAGSDGAFMTGKNGAAPDSSGGGFTQKGVSYNVNPSSQDGITKITSTKTNPLYTNIRPEDATSGLKNQMVGGDAASVQEGLDRHARANAITQSIIDKQPQGGVGILNDPNNVDAANAEKTARWRQDELLQAGKYGNRAAGEAIQANARLSGDQLHSATTQRGQGITGGITARGQDLAAQTAAKQLAVDSPLKDAQAQGILAQTDSARMLADIQKKALAGDAQAAASYRALTGKSAPASDRYMTVQGGDEISPDGTTKIKRPSGVFDAQTQQFVPMNGGQQQGPAQAPASALEFLKKNPSQSAAFKAKYGYTPEGF